MLAIELLLFEFSGRALIPLIVSSSVAAGVHSMLLEPEPLSPVPAHDYSGLSRLPVFEVVGAASRAYGSGDRRRLTLHRGALPPAAGRKTTLVKGVKQLAVVDSDDR